MKQVILAIVSLFVFSLANATAETKKVCHDEIKNGKSTQVCKTIKIHKKLEGTNVQDTKSKK
jgi:hypothetical protein